MITTGEIDRLNGRANKRLSTITFIPSEYIDDSELTHDIENIIAFIQEKNISIDLALFLLSLNILRSKDLIKGENLTDVLKFHKKTFKHDNLTNEIKLWYKELDKTDLNNYHQELFSKVLPEVNDLLGVIYQSLSLEGDKAKKGSYYTPKSIVDDIVNSHLNKSNEETLILDPCCGTGQFLLSASNKIKNPKNIWGFDIDRLAVRIAKVNLLVKFNNFDFAPNIFVKNTLLESHNNSLFANTETPSFDLIITNPPWGVHFSNDELFELQQNYPQIKSQEAFSYFIKAGLNLLKKDGILSYVLPESILNIKVHKDIREVILKETQITEISYLDRVFKNVFTPVIRLDLKKTNDNIESKFIAKRNSDVFEIKQARLLNNSDSVFDIFCKELDLRILEKVYSEKHTTLKDQADWALGIVTGNNEKFLSATKLKNYEPIFTGKEVGRYLFKPEQNYIKFEPDNFQQTAPESKYRAKEKLVYKFISKYLVFAYDNKQKLTLNSANILIPKLENYPIKVILALFNSTLYQFIFEKKTRAIKLLRADLEKLPLPLWDQEVFSHISHQVDSLLDLKVSNEKRQNIYSELDDYIMKRFDLNQKEISYIKENSNISKKLLFS
jgi:tRNA1(Val) A37 N6-methylase TrmN6